MKIGMKGTWALLTKWRCWFWDRARTARNCARSAPECTYSQFMIARSEGLQ